MNIDNVEAPEEIPKNILKALFEKQTELLEKYREIENMPLTFNIETAETQKWVKDFAWRITEELCEAQEAEIIFSVSKDEKHFIHYLEEMSDALHFMVELCIISDYDETIFMELNNENMNWTDIVFELGLACNCLKNKPWKQSQMLTDKAKYKSHIQHAFSYLILLLKLEKLSMKDIYILYFKKNAVNHFRIRSKY